MAYSIPDDVVDRVRESADIVEVIGEHLPLKPAGRNMKALCPFHPEKTPSFMVSPEKQIYHCFGCGAGGNVFNFLMQFESITFPEAVRSLAKRYGIPVPDLAPGRSSETSIAYKINALAAKTYHAALSGTKEGTRARRYLRSRGVDETIEKDFLLGYSPSDGNFLVQEARRRKVDDAKLRALGLAVERDGKVRDLFRRRLIFPIASPGGRVLGFGGRVLDDGMPKYLNSPETRLFKKSETLYGLHRAKTELRSRGLAIVVEGYMDVIPLHVSGLRNTVGSLGTAFTFEQVRNLSRYCDEAVLLYDGDEAGRLAALRGCGPAAQAGLRVRIAKLPEGDDPDSFVRTRGKDALDSVIAKAAHYVDFVMDQVEEDDIEQAIRYALGIIGKIKDPIRLSLDLKRLADRSGIAEVTLQRAMRSLPKEQPEETRAGRDTITCDKIEKSIVSIMIGLPQCTDTIFEAISPSDFADRRMRKIAEVILDRKSRNLGFDVSALLSAVEDEPTRNLLLDCSAADELVGDPDRIVSDHVCSMRRKVLNREIAQLRKQIQIAEREGDADLLEALLSRRQNLAQDLRLLST